MTISVPGHFGMWFGLSSASWHPGTIPKRIETARGTVEVARMGQGASVLCLHGGMGGWDQSLLLARAALGDVRGLDILAPSRPGYLGTPLEGHRTPQEQADLYAALLDRLGIHSTLILALSAGGPSALAFAARHRERCAGLVLMSACTGRLDVPHQVQARLPVFSTAAHIPGFAVVMGQLTAQAPERAARFSILDADVCARTLAHPEAGPFMRAVQERIFEHMAERLTGTRHDIDGLSALPPTMFDGVSVPVLAMHGTADRVVPFAHGQRLAQGLPGVRFLPIRGGEHVCLFTHLDTVRRGVAGFLDALGSW